jgi:hypothetical protein
MIDDELEISDMLAERRMHRVLLRAYPPVPYPGGAKKYSTVPGTVVNESIPYHKNKALLTVTSS